MTLPIINNILDAIICDKETIYVQFSETNLQISNEAERKAVIKNAGQDH